MGIPGKLRIYMDGACPFCRAAQARIERFDSHHRLEFLDYNDAAVVGGIPFSRDELAAEMHVRKPDGTWVKGFFGWAAILQVLPAWKWLGWLMAVPPFRWMGPSFYHWVARNRYSLPGMPPPCDAQGCNLAHDDHILSDSKLTHRPVPHSGGTR